MAAGLILVLRIVQLTAALLGMFSRLNADLQCWLLALLEWPILMIWILLHPR